MFECEEEFDNVHECIQLSKGFKSRFQMLEEAYGCQDCPTSHEESKHRGSHHMESPSAQPQVHQTKCVGRIEELQACRCLNCSLNYVKQGSSYHQKLLKESFLSDKTQKRLPADRSIASNRNRKAILMKKLRVITGSLKN